MKDAYTYLTCDKYHWIRRCPLCDNYFELIENESPECPECGWGREDC